MIYAPESPSTQALHEANPIERDTHRQIAMARIALNTTIIYPNNEFLLVGPCALTEDAEALDDENRAWNEYAAANGLEVVVRRHPWKPRSVEEWIAKMRQWHGLETGYADGKGDPSDAARTAYEMLHRSASTYGNISMEMAFDEHVLRYGPLLAFAQIGARTPSQYHANEASYLKFLDLLAKREPTLPLGIKNDEDGNIDRALRDVNRVNTVRAGLGMSAISRAVLIFRGGTSIRTPEAWEASAIAAIERTGGAVILDTAHGGEQAFDPDGKYAKSEIGQLLCIERAVELQQRGLRYVGIASESSDIPSPMDPPAATEQVKMRLQAARDVMALS